MSKPSTVWLSARDYADLANRLARKIVGSPSLRPPHRPESLGNYTERFRIMFRWTKQMGEAGQQLRLEIRNDSAGAYLALYVGEGDMVVGEGLVASWSVYQEQLSPLREFYAAGVRITPSDDYPVGEPFQLSVDWPEASELPGYNPALPPLIKDVIGQVTHWLRHQMPDLPIKETM